MCMKKNAILLLAAVVTIGMITCSPNRGGALQGWTLVWEDTFGTSLNTSNWSKVPQGENPRDWFMSNDNSLYRFHEGDLVLIGLRNSEEGEEVQPFITGGITTAGNRSFSSVSRIEARLRTLPVPGAIYKMSLLSPTNENVYINVMSRFGTDAFIFQSVSSDFTQEVVDNPPAISLIRIPSDNYYVFSVELHADSLVFFVNNQRTKMYPRIETDAIGQFPFNEQEFNLFFGVSVNQNPLPEDDFQSFMFIDWVRHFVPE